MSQQAVEVHFLCDSNEPAEAVPTTISSSSPPQTTVLDQTNKSHISKFSHYSAPIIQLPQ